MSAQRSKVGEKSTMQIGRVDKVESKRQVTSLKRKYSKISSTATATAGCSREAEGSSSDSPNPASQSESEYSSSEGPRTRNFLDVSRVAAAVIRHGISNRATSAYALLRWLLLKMLGGFQRLSTSRVLIGIRSTVRSLSL